MHVTSVVGVWYAVVIFQWHAFQTSLHCQRLTPPSWQQIGITIRMKTRCRIHCLVDSIFHIAHRSFCTSFYSLSNYVNATPSFSILHQWVEELIQHDQCALILICLLMQRLDNWGIYRFGYLITGLQTALFFIVFKNWHIFQ